VLVNYYVFVFMSQDTPVIKYYLSIDSAEAHLFRVKMILSHPNPDGQILSLPAWIPGSYMIRNFARHLHQLNAYEAQSGDKLDIKQLDKQSWKIEATAQPLCLEYQVYAFDYSVRSAYLTTEYGFLNGTSMFLCAEDQENLPCELSICLPEQYPWRIATTLASKETHLHEYSAKDYATLIDHPVLMGNFEQVDFECEGVAFSMVFAGQHRADLQTIAKDVEPLCRHHLNFFPSDTPINKYLFITLLAEKGYGGLEHMDSTVLMFPRNDLPSKYSSKPSSRTDRYLDYLSLCSHEFFHTWNVKRIRPQELANASLSEEAYTRQLWFYEGITSYYDDLSLVRTGLANSEQYLTLLGRQLTRLQRNPGRLQQSLLDSSFNAWTKFYLQDASSTNHIVSYYNKGAVLALCLDLWLRKYSQYSLDDLMALVWQRYGSQDRPTLEHTVHQILQDDFALKSDVLENWLNSREDLPVAELLESVGIKLHYRAATSQPDKGGNPASDGFRYEFGTSVTSDPVGAKITQVINNSPAQHAGLQIDDIVIALNQWQVNAKNLRSTLDEQQQSVTLSYFRDGILHQEQLALVAAKRDCIYLTIEDLALAQNWLQFPKV
jgi:predicted metalloprotease with PDZ domain